MYRFLRSCPMLCTQVSQLQALEQYNENPDAKLDKAHLKEALEYWAHPELVWPKSAMVVYAVILLEHALRCGFDAANNIKFRMALLRQLEKYASLQ